MKILHTSDLHIGKRINEYSMLEEQEFILEEIVRLAQTEQTDAIILAGDIYDKSIPSAEAVSLFDDFLVKLAGLGKAIFIISGNHDSAERISFASRIMEASKVYLSPVYNGNIQPIILNDGETEVAFHLLPFIKPSMVQHYAEDGVEIKTYDEAMRHVISKMSIDKSRRNVLITHQFITNAERSESEDIMVGGLDNIDASAFDAFDYVALGHLHRPQSCGYETIRYSGSPLKYSFSEVNDKKSVSIIEITGNEEVRISTRPLKPLHDWHDLKGTYEELTAKKYYEGTDLQEAFVRITLTDEDDIPDGMRKLKTIYHRLMELRYDNKRTRAGMTLIGKPMDINSLDPGQLFGELFEKQNAQELSDEQSNYLQTLIDQIFNNQ
ncbi:MAG: exonuclease SbcCD subunit D [Bacteroidaceae bacterium]|nr:exonuclease SbcCD subunit D [Bacteroidaceae bacterium]